MLIDQIIEEKKGALKADDVAPILALSVKQVYKMAATGELPSLRIASSVRFDPQDLAAWLRARSSAPPTEPRTRASANQSRPKRLRESRETRHI